MIVYIDQFVEQKHSLDTILLILPKIKQQLSTIKTLYSLVETNIPSLLKPEDKTICQEVYTYDNNLLTNINEAESQTTKNMQRFKTTLKDRLDKMLK